MNKWNRISIPISTSTMNRLTFARTKFRNWKFLGFSWTLTNTIFNQGNSRRKIHVRMLLKICLQYLESVLSHSKSMYPHYFEWQHDLIKFWKWKLCFRANKSTWNLLRYEKEQENVLEMKWSGTICFSSVSLFEATMHKRYKYLCIILIK